MGCLFSKFSDEHCCVCHCVLNSAIPSFSSPSLTTSSAPQSALTFLVTLLLEPSYSLRPFVALVALNLSHACRLFISSLLPCLDSHPHFPHLPNATTATGPKRQAALLIRCTHHGSVVLQPHGAAHSQRDYRMDHDQLSLLPQRAQSVAGKRKTEAPFSLWDKARGGETYTALVTPLTRKKKEQSISSSSLPLYLSLSLSLPPRIPSDTTSA